MMANDNVRTARRPEDDNAGKGSGAPLTASPFSPSPFRRREPVGWLASALAFAVIVCALIFVATALFGPAPFGPRWWE